MAAVDEDPRYSREFIHEFRDDRAFAIKAVKYSGMLLKHLSETLRKDNEHVIHEYFSTDESYTWDDPEMSSRIIADYPWRIKLVPIPKRTDTLLRIVLVNPGDHIEELIEDHPELLREKKWLRLLLPNYPDYYIGLSEELRVDPEVIDLVLDYCRVKVYYKLPDYIKEDRACVLRMVSGYGYLIDRIPKRFQHDKEIVLAALSSTGKVYRRLSADMKKDPDVQIAAIEQDGLDFKTLSDKYKTTEVCTAAVTHKLENILFVPSALVTDMEFIGRFTSESRLESYLRKRSDVDESLMRSLFGVESEPPSHTATHSVPYGGSTQTLVPYEIPDDRDIRYVNRKTLK